jgi:hypothetical protein
MSTPESEVKVETKEITPEMVRELVEKASPTEWKYLMKLKLSRRVSGCGWVYKYGWDLQTLWGNVDIVKLREKEYHDCTIESELLLIPKTVPVVVMLSEWNDDPQVKDTVTTYVFTIDGWKSVETEVPK